jgi:tetratricopeptide (TPR) repeat protein
MRSILFLSGVCVALLAMAPAGAQEVVQALPGTTEADALAANMRRLAVDPRDIDALVDAASLSLKLGDTRAAAALLARAEGVDGRNPRVKAGQGSILVQSERPGEALRYFAQAEAWGLAPRAFAADRALAYDLTGEQERAQRDYRVALRDTPADDEAIRRYALSLGIAGQRERALALLDPLIRRGDRSAWRAQAFVLAMTGDVAGASRIAATMMPGGAAGLSAFFARLPQLPAADRAFAVHFGQVRATPERLADARLAPPLPALARETGAALTLASVAASPPVRQTRREALRTPVTTGEPARTSVTTAAVAAAPRRVISASGLRQTDASASPRPAVPSVSRATLVASAPAATPAAGGTAPAASASAIASVGPTSAPAVAPLSPVTAIQTAAIPTSSASMPVTQPGPVAAVTPLPVTAAPRPAAPVRSLASTRASEDSILARIVAGLSIPASELDVEAPARAPAVVVQAPVATRAVVARVDPAIAARAKAERLAADKLTAAKSAVDKRAVERKAVADKKALAEKKVAAAKKAIADAEAAEARKLARANPPRIWVQVAGGAHEGDLPKAWRAVKAKAPAVFGSRQGWTTPLRATNRVLAGPFKTEAEARGFVNDLQKQGVSAFTFSSDVGQPVKRLGG